MKEKNKIIRKVYYGNGGKSLLLTVPKLVKEKLNLKRGDSVIIFINDFFATIEKGELEQPEVNRTCNKLYQGSRDDLLILSIPALMRDKLKLDDGDNVLYTISDCGMAIVEKVEI